jgi:chemotaxis protein methyltransferase WspC
LATSGETLSEARALADRGQLSESLVAAESLLAREGPSAAVLMLVGTLRLALGDMNEARDALTKVLYFEPRNEDVLLQLAMIHHRLGDPTQAQRYRRRAAKSHQISERGKTP